jgi:cyclic pyranopterin phosphate synthase
MATMAFPARALPRTLSPKVLRPHALRLRQWQCRQLATAATAAEYSDPESFVPESQQTPQAVRQAKIRQAKPFSEFLTDNLDRQHDYLRISLTERCNLRCTYCMPEEGIQLSPNRDILTTAEIHYISALFVNQGVNKIRLTGGEPTVRKDIIPLMRQIGSLRSNGLKELALTTNGISLHRKLDDMVEAGLTGVNISLDTLDPFQFQILTRRQGFSAVMKSIDRVKEMNKLGAGIKLKINCVMMRGLNDHQLLPFVEMTQTEDVEVRFIEYMPFGGNKWNKKKMMSYEDMLDAIRVKYPDIARLKDARNDTSKTWQVPGFVGRVGFITSMTHNFCGSCNRLRITSDGNLKVCLHGEAEVSLRDLLRKDHGGDPMDEEAFEAVRKIELDRRSNPGLRFDGEEGWMSKEQQLLDVIGAAVKRKKVGHAGMGHLENMKNRPMILIGG